jgi:hypothetical protein
MQNSILCRKSHVKNYFENLISKSEMINKDRKPHLYPSLPEKFAETANDPDRKVTQILRTLSAESLDVYTGYIRIRKP